MENAGSASSEPVGDIIPLEDVGDADKKSHFRMLFRMEEAPTFILRRPSSLIILSIKYLQIPQSKIQRETSAMH